MGSGSQTTGKRLPDGLSRVVGWAATRCRGPLYFPLRAPRELATRILGNIGKISVFGPSAGLALRERGDAAERHFYLYVLHLSVSSPTSRLTLTMARFVRGHRLRFPQGFRADGEQEHWGQEYGDSSPLLTGQVR